MQRLRGAVGLSVGVLAPASLMKFVQEWGGQVSIKADTDDPGHIEIDTTPLGCHVNCHMLTSVLRMPHMCTAQV